MSNYGTMLAEKIATTAAKDAGVGMQDKYKLANYLMDAICAAEKELIRDETTENRYTSIDAKGGEVTLFIGMHNAELTDVQKQAVKELFMQTKERLMHIVGAEQ